VAFLAQRDQVVRRVAARFAALYVVHVQYFVSAAVFAPAFVPVAEQHVLARVPEVKLFALLVLLALYFRVLNFLYIERRDLDYDLAYWQDFVYIGY